MNQLTPENLDRIKLLQPLFKEKMGIITEGDMFFNPFRKRVCFVDKGTLVIDGCFVIPKLYDWQNPERGLWGMIKGEKHLEEYTTYCEVWTDGGTCHETPDPFTAILKALCKQEEV